MHECSRVHRESVGAIEFRTISSTHPPSPLPPHLPHERRSLPLLVQLRKVVGAGDYRGYTLDRERRRRRWMGYEWRSIRCLLYRYLLLYFYCCLIGQNRTGVLEDEKRGQRTKIILPYLFQHDNLTTL